MVLSAFFTKEYRTDLCVVGGGIAGICTAISAARGGLSVVLIQDRAVLGGNASSEIRMWMCGSSGEKYREAGLVEELELENYYRNPGCKYSIWDSVLFEKVKAEKNITLLLNSSCLDAQTDGKKIVCVTAWQSNAETVHKVYAEYFADCSGDSVLSVLTGAGYMYGRESREQYGESLAYDEADSKTMGMSCIMQLRETPSKKEFIPPEWAYVYETDEAFSCRVHNLHDNFWWIEVGGMGDCIHDTDECRDELLKIAYGVWDHMKNRGDHGADNWELEWIGMLPGKRESRRYIGEYIINQCDIENGGHYSDVVAYGGWHLDDHYPEGFYYNKGIPNTNVQTPPMWGIPLRALISRDIKNLVFAGRNISATHIALSATRGMATCGLIGQALGTALSCAVKSETDIRNIDVAQVQNILLENDCALPSLTREVPELSKKARCSAEVVRNGIERGQENLWHGENGDGIEYHFDNEVTLGKVRIVFDSNLGRSFFNMPCRYPLGAPDCHMPETLVKEYELIFTDRNGNETKIAVNDNRRRLVIHHINIKAVSAKLVPIKTYGNTKPSVFTFEVS